MLTLLLSAFLTATAPPASYALVVTNNRSLDASHPDLHYADDDGAKYADLFAEAFGADHVTLLTQFDAETRVLFPRWLSAVRPPTRQNLDQSISALADALAHNHAQGRETNVIVVFAGHGDIDHGQGYLELLDGRLTAHDLELAVIQRLPATRLHLILDSCNSYFMLNPRKPGGVRFRSIPDEASSLLARHPNVGAIVSTSAEAVTYEWSEVQSGIFSYEVRSGLRGAADVNGDGKVSYEELTAFINVANRPILNDLYRPKVFAGAPAKRFGETLMQFTSAPMRVLHVAEPQDRRLTVRDALGVRILDVHKEAGAALALTLPPGGELGLYETLGDKGADGRPEVRYLALADQGSLSLSTPAVTPAPFSSRGDSPVFTDLFREPFGPEAFSHAPELIAETARAPAGVTKKDVERLAAHLNVAVARARDASLRAAVGVFIVGAGFGVVTDAVLTHPDASPVAARNIALFSVGSGLVLGGALAGYVMSVTPEEVKLQRAFSVLPKDTDAAREAAVLQSEQQFAQFARDSRNRRIGMGGLDIGLGALFGFEGFLLLDSRSGLLHPVGKPNLLNGLLSGAVGVLDLVQGLASLTVYRAPAELAWEQYQADPDVKERSAVSPGVRLGINPVALNRGGGLALNGQF